MCSERCLGSDKFLIRDDHVHICADVFLDVLRQCSAFHVGSMEETKIISVGYAPSDIEYVPSEPYPPRAPRSPSERADASPLRKGGGPR